MKLSQYISESNTSAASFARSVGVEPAAVSYWISGARNPSIEKCQRIEFVTDGAVRCEDMRPDLNWAYLRGTKRKAA